MGEAEGREQLATALTEAMLHKCITFITARELFPFIIGGTCVQRKSHVTGRVKEILMGAAPLVGGWGREWELVTNLHCSTC